MTSGRLPHAPTEILRDRVASLVSFGVTQEDIALCLDLDVDTLKKHYPRELATGALVANEKVAARLYNKAVKADDFKAQEFWLKTKGRWRTTDKEVEAVANQNLELQLEIARLKAEMAEKHTKDY